jgi:hypothetical protein
MPVPHGGIDDDIAGPQTIREDELGPAHG